MAALSDETASDMRGVGLLRNPLFSGKPGNLARRLDVYVPPSTAAERVPGLSESFPSFPTAFGLSRGHMV
eukprot:1631168-Pyramimonas_sp.AAC.1